METDFPIKRTRKAKTRLLRLAPKLGMAIAAVALITLRGALAQTVSSGASSAPQSPIIGGRIDIWTDGLHNEATAVAYNSNHDEYLVVWHTLQDAHTHDIWAQRIDGDGTLLTGFNVATAPGEKREDPAVAYNSVQDEYLIVYTNWYTEGITSDVFAKRVSWNGGWMSSEIAITQVPDQQYSPAVTYNGIDDEYLVVFVNYWESGLIDIDAKRVRGSDGALLSWDIVASGMEAARRGPSVAYSTAANGGSGGYLIAYDYYHITTHAEEIRAKVSQADLADLWTNPEITLCTSGNYQLTPAVASGREGYLAIWWEDRPGGYQVRGRRVGSDGTPLGSADGFGIGEVLPNFPTEPALAYGEGYGYLATWRYYATISLPPSIHGRYVMDGQDSASGGPFVVEGGDSHGPSVACAPSGDCLVVYLWRNVSDDEIGGRFVRPHHVYLPLVVRDF